MNTWGVGNGPMPHRPARPGSRAITVAIQDATPGTGLPPSWGWCSGRRHQSLMTISVSAWARVRSRVVKVGS